MRGGAVTCQHNRDVYCPRCEAISRLPYRIVDHHPGSVQAGLTYAKVRGDYTFVGTCRTVFSKGSGAVRCVLEDERGLLFIFSPTQLVRVEPTP